MEYVKPSPTGVDIHIQKLQRFLYPRLKTLWGIADDVAYDCYGRAYKNQVRDGAIPEAYIGGNEYREVLFDDGRKVISFFGVGDSIRYDAGTATAPVSLIFMVNLAQVKGGITRADEEVHVDVQKLLQPGRSGFAMTSFETGIENVFKEYPGWRRDPGLKYRDMQPFHCFRINLSLSYNIQDC